LQNVELVPVLIGEFVGVEAAASIGVATLDDILTELLFVHRTELLLQELLREYLLAFLGHCAGLSEGVKGDAEPRCQYPRIILRNNHS